MKISAVALLLLAGSLFLQNVVAQSRHTKPNILVILTDDQAFRAIGYNNPYIKTPNLDQLAKAGVIFDNAFTVSPICVASRASLLTGMYPQRHGTVALNTRSFVDAVVTHKGIATLPQQLQAAGYLSFFAGKSHLGPPKDYGFALGAESNDFTDSLSFAQVHSFIQKADLDRQPFFIWLGARQPHLPLKPRQQFLDLYPASALPLDPNFLEQPPPGSLYNQGLPGETLYLNSDYTDNHQGLSAGPPRSVATMKEFLSAYYATVSQLDAQVGRLIDALRAKKLLHNTVIVFLSDNGYFLGNHGLGNKITMFEESVRVPFFINWSGLPNKNIRHKALVSNIDLFPTLLDIAGIPIPATLQGRSLKKLLQHPDDSLHQYVVSECTGVGGKPGTGHRMVRTSRYKYILSDVNEEALFDLSQDPYELRNVLEDAGYRPVSLELRKYLSQWKRDLRDKKEYP